jgi:hypothetical protein
MKNAHLLKPLPFGTIERIDLGGSAWQNEANIRAPRIWGARGPGYAFEEDVVGLTVGDVYVERLPAERFYAGLDPSFVQRVAALHGTEQDWRLRYRKES